MSLRSILKRSVVRVVRSALSCTRSRGDLSSEISLPISLTVSKELSSLNDPEYYIEFLVSCIKRAKFQVRNIKSPTSNMENAASKRFSALIQILKTDVPPMAFSRAQKIASIADICLGNFQSLEFKSWAGDISLHFKISSSSASKGRLLSAIVRLMRPSSCLELGSGYGMSGMFILSALEANGGAGCLTTIEASEPQFSLSRKILTDSFGERVSCHKGLTAKQLPDLVSSIGSIDFMFHDAEHSRESYINDFTVVEPYLNPGAVVIFDDLRWDDPRFHAGSARTYEGWTKIVGHPRVKQALEVDGKIGMLLVE